MRVLEINSVCGSGSTGRICTDIAGLLEQRGDPCAVAYGRGHVPEAAQKYAHPIGTAWDCRLHGLETRLFDAHGFGSRRATREFLRWAEDWKPDVAHLHNLHGYYLQVEELFAFLKANGLPVVWTLHDCWAFTGHCAYFSGAGCGRWREGCRSCPLTREYPACYGFSNVSRNYARKKAAFTGVKELTLVTPSRWLADLTRQSFLREYPVRVIPNGIDLTQFRPMQSGIREKLGIPAEKRLVLGVANVWNERKGLSDFLKLAELLGGGAQILLVGLSEKQKQALPANVLGVTRTESVRELAELYTAADIFLNPTYEDNFPTTNLEALACGTPVVTYRTGGSPESVTDSCGAVIPQGDLDAAAELALHGRWSPAACTARAAGYDRTERFREYLSLYDGLTRQDREKTL